MKGIELGRSIGAVARGPAAGIGRVGPSAIGFRGFEAPRVAMSMAARSLARDFAPIKIANRVNNISPLNTREVVAQAEGILGLRSTRVSLDRLAPVNINPARAEAVVARNIPFFTEPSFKPEPKKASRIFMLPARILKADYIAQSSPAIKSGEKTVPRVFAEASQLYKVVHEPKSQPAPAGVEQPVKAIPQFQEQEVENVVEEVVLEKRKVEDIKEDEDVLELKKVYLEDEEVQEVRQVELKTAIRKAFEQALKYGWEKITGEQVAQFLPVDHENNRSQIVKKKGPDGTNLAVKQGVAQTGDLYSEEGAQQILDKILEQNKPVRLGKNSEHGKKVSLDEVKKVLRPKKINPVVLEFVTRIVKKKQIKGKVVQYEPESHSSIT